MECFYFWVIVDRGKSPKSKPAPLPTFFSLYVKQLFKNPFEPTSHRFFYPRHSISKLLFDLSCYNVITIHNKNHYDIYYKKFMVPFTPTTQVFLPLLPLLTLFFFKPWPFKCLLICIKVHPTPYKLVLYLDLVCAFLGLLPLNGFSQSETNQLDGLKNMFPSVFLIKHWMESCVINYDCWMHHCLKDLHYWTKVTVVTG